MKFSKIALLGTAALVSASISAYASEASDIAALKAQITALSAQVAADQASSEIPNGFELITMSMQPSILDPTVMAHTIAILPTADAPASTTVQWTGLARAALVYNNHHDVIFGTLSSTPIRAGISSSSSATHIKARGELQVVGKTDTAVGEVGVNIVLRGDFDGAGDADVYMHVAKGWWALTPNVSLIAGYDGMTGGVGGYGADKLQALYTDGAPNSGGTPGDTTQFALAYSDGPINFKAAVGYYLVSDYAFGAQAEYKGDAMSAKVAGWVHGSDYQVGLGVTASMDIISLSVSGVIGRELNHSFLVPFGASADANYWNASVFAGATLSESVKAEIGVGYNSYVATGLPVGITEDRNKLGLAGGIYYSPVAQLTIGAEASWNKEHTNVFIGFVPLDVNYDVTTVAADIVTVFKF